MKPDDDKPTSEYEYINGSCLICGAKLIVVDGQIWCEREYLVIEKDRPHTPQKEER